MAFSVCSYPLQLENCFDKSKIFVAEEMLNNCKAYLNSDFYNVILFFVKYNKINIELAKVIRIEQSYFNDTLE